MKKNKPVKDSKNQYPPTRSGQKPKKVYYASRWPLRTDKQPKGLGELPTLIPKKTT
ncbi:MAG: hypothetical protein HQM16_15655 [Deltaproteobacteria bacterium]|nr:hypothetical protein [Deltaproteobacteria bacterium]